jgi:hypothetical protein
MEKWKEPGLEKMKAWESNCAESERKSKLEIVLGRELGGAWETMKDLLRDKWMEERKEKRLGKLYEQKSE